MNYGRLLTAFFAVLFIVVFFAGLVYLIHLFAHVIAEAIV